MNASRGLFAFDAYVFSLSRSGPMFPDAPAASSLWHEEQPFDANALFPAARFPPPADGSADAGAAARDRGRDDDERNGRRSPHYEVDAPIFATASSREG